MAQIENPRKDYAFSVHIMDPNNAEVDNFLCQEITLPDSEIDQVEHGDINFDVKTPGKRKTGNFMVDKILHQASSDVIIWNWHELCQSLASGTGSLAANIKMPIRVHELNENQKPIQTWYFMGCWPQKINGQKLKRAGDAENSIESIEFSVDKIAKVGGADSNPLI